MKGIFIGLLVAFILMEAVAWKAYTASKEKQNPQASVAETQVTQPSEPEGIVETEPAREADSVSESPNPSSDTKASEENGTYPRISVEEKNGKTERTIHMGVRQWAWDPAELRVKQGELVRLVIHNADVRHAIVIPELGVEADIPEEGAIVEFTASRRGTFDFLCATYCGTGHAMMQGRVVVE